MPVFALFVYPYLLRVYVCCKTLKPKGFGVLIKILLANGKKYKITFDCIVFEQLNAHP